MNKPPQFLYVPQINTNGFDKMIIHPKHQVYWRIVEFETAQQQAQWIVDNEDYLAEKGYISVNIHKKYPYILVCVSNGEITDLDKLTKIGNRASDWYAQFWLKNAQNSKIKDNLDASHYYLCENRQKHYGKLGIVKLSFPRCFIWFDDGDAYFADYDNFYAHIADVQWLDGEKPPADELEEIMIEAYNFMVIEDRILENDLE